MRRKKWSEEEEQTLIAKYSEMSQGGALVKLKTREKKFQPIAAHVNALHHFRDSGSFPWEWSWRDLSVKIQNMRHQYLGVKQKIRRPSFSPEQQQQQQEEYDWQEGIVHWSNFLRYKEVFGDLPIESNDLGTGGSSPASTHQNTSFDGKVGRGRGRMPAISSKFTQAFVNGPRLPGEGGGSTIGNLEVEDMQTGAGDPGVSELGLECYDCEDDLLRDEEEEELGSKKKKAKRHRDRMKILGSGAGALLTEGRIFAFLGAFVTDQRERDQRKEAREREKEREREERDSVREAAEREREQSRQERERIREEQERRREREREERDWEREVVNRERWEEERQRERAWEEKREKAKREWRERMISIQLGHQASIAQMQVQMMQSQQNVLSLLLGVVLHGSPVEETPGQRSSLALQILHNLQQQHVGSGTFQAGERKGGIDESTTNYVIDGGVHVTGSE